MCSNRLSHGRMVAGEPLLTPESSRYTPSRAHTTWMTSDGCHLPGGNTVPGSKVLSMKAGANRLTTRPNGAML